MKSLAFWMIRGDFDPAWWIANGFLLVYPLLFISRFVAQQPIVASQ
jgi:hypothetical protein